MSNISPSLQFSISIASFGPKKRRPELNLFAFPHDRNPLDNGRLIDSIKLKKNNRYFEINVHFDENKRTSIDGQKRKLCEEIASEQDDKRKATAGGRLWNKNRKKKCRKDVLCPNSVMPKQTLQGQMVGSSTIPYAVGHLNGQDHDVRLFPLTGGTYQFRTDFGYIDCEIPTQNSLEHLHQDDGESTGVLKEEDGGGDAKRIVLRYENVHELDNGDRPKRCYFDQLQKRLQQEPWTELAIENSRLSRIECSSCSRSKSDPISLLNAFETFHHCVKKEAGEEERSHQRTTIVADKMSRMDSNQNGIWPTTGYLPFSQHTITTCMRPSDQLRYLLINAKVLSFARIRQLISNPIDTNLLLNLLQQHGNLVQGNWVVKSSVLFPKVVPLIGADLMRKLAERGSNERSALIFDCVNLCFLRHRSIKRCDVLNWIKVGHEELLEMFELVSTFDQENKRWTLLYAKDDEFIQNHPDIVRQQESLWEMRRLQLEQALNWKTCCIKKEEEKPEVKHLRNVAVYKRTSTRRTSGLTNEIISADSNKAVKPVKAALDKKLIKTKKMAKSLIKAKRMPSGFKTKAKQFRN